MIAPAGWRALQVIPAGMPPRVPRERAPAVAMHPATRPHDWQMQDVASTRYGPLRGMQCKDCGMIPLLHGERSLAVCPGIPA